MRQFAFAAMLLAFSVSARADDKTDAAIQMLAVAIFVTECPGLQADYSFVRSSFDALGVKTSDIEDNPTNKLKVMVIVSNMNKNRNHNCRIAWEQFGENGSALAGLLRKK